MIPYFSGFTIESVSAAEGYSSSVVDPVITTSIMRVFNTDTQPFPWPFNTVTHVETVLAATKGKSNYLGTDTFNHFRIYDFAVFI